jgi:hypothetical protein
MNFGTYQYIGLVSSVDPSLQLVSKTLFTLSSTLSLSTTPSQWSLSCCQPVDNNKFYFAYVAAANGNNFQSYYLLFDKCVDRDASGYCLACMPNSYRPVGFGADNKNFIVSPCSQSPTCRECQSDYTKCTSCDTGNKYYLYETISTCQNTQSFYQGMGPNITSGFVEECIPQNCLRCQNTIEECTSCDESVSTYLYQAKYTCLNKTSFPPSYGVNNNVNPKVVQPCQDPHCKNCTDDISICVSCDTSLLYYLYQTTSTCLNSSTFPVGKGPNITTGVVESCVDSSCTSCPQNIAVCALCDNGQGRYLYQTNNTCLAKVEFPPSYGVNNNVNPKVVQPCQDPHCKNCTDDISICVSCDTSLLYYLYQTTSTCLNSSTFPVGKGPNITTGVVESCVDSSCTSCPQNIAVCALCDNGQGRYLYQTNNTCLAKVEFPPSYGVNNNVNPKVVQPCQDPHCKNCTDDISICVSCDTSLLYYLYQTTSTCLNSSTFPVGKGPNITTGVVESCVDSSCTSCPQNIAVCALCDNGQGRYLYQTNNTCLAKVEFPPSYGVNNNVNPKVVQPCQDPHCKNCTDDISICVSCDTSLLYYLYQTTSTCLNSSTFPVGKGPNITTGVVESCVDSSCTSCPQNIAVCALCDNGQGRYLYQTNNTCLAKVEFPPSYGVNNNVNPKVVQPCQDPHCKNCTDDISICVSCDTSLLYYLYQTTSTCLNSSTFPVGKGPNITTGVVESCVDSSCTSCPQNIAVCALCDNGQGRYLYQTNNTCLAKVEFPPSYGVNNNVNPKVVQPCQDPHCKNCTDDISICVSCDTSLLYYLYQTTSTCLNSSTFPVGKGPNITTGVVESCVDSSCTSCPQNIAVCALCDNGQGRYLYQTNNTCLAKVEFPPSYGVNNNVNPKVVQPCQDPHCKNCTDDISICVSCDTSLLYYLYQTTSTCLNSSTFPVGKGPNITTGVVESCVDSSCTSCPQNIAVCALCDNGQGRYLYQTNNTCLAKVEFPPSYGVNNNVNPKVVQPCQDPHCKNCTDDISICVSCDTSLLYYLYQTTSTCLNSSTFPVGKGPNITTGVVESCVDSSCTSCPQNIAVCALCDNGQGRYLYQTNNTCLAKVEFPPSYGVNNNVNPKVVQPCQDPHCKNCTDDISICVSCDTSLLYYLYQTTSTCLNSSTFPVGKGPNITTGVVESCVDSSCTSCPQNIAVCALCDNGQGRYLYQTNNTCLAKVEFPPSYGVNNNVNPKVVQPCQDPHCKNCTDDISICVSCDTSLLYYLYQTTSTCLNSSTFPVGKGPNITTGVVESCVDSSCTSCPQNIAVCALCDNGQGRYLYQTNNTCLAKVEFPPSYGVNNNVNPKVVQPCQDPHCKNCTDDISICVSCDTSLLYYLYQTTSTCLNSSTFPVGKGPNITTGVVESCVDSSCTSCPQNIAVCALCDNGQGRYLYQTNNTCLAKVEFPPSYGVNNNVNPKVVQPCQDPHCKNCTDDISICVSCDTSLLYYLYQTTSTCLNSSTFPVGKGPNITTGVVESCVDSSCTSCPQNIAVCALCDNGQGRYLYQTNNTCLAKVEFPPSARVPISPQGLSRVALTLAVLPVPKILPSAPCAIMGKEDICTRQTIPV